MKLQWLASCLCLVALSSACAGSSKQVAAQQAQARARRERMAREREARVQASEEKKAREEEEARKNHPLARAVAAQEAAGDQPKVQATSEEPDAEADKRDKHVGVRGIEGTLSNFDVRMAMEKQGKAFAKCHESRARKVPVLAGAIEFRIHVLRSGDVSEVNVRVSDLGDRIVERCMSEVIEQTKFPVPHGGEADVTWNMQLELRRGRKVEQWDEDRVDRVVRKNRGELLETCDAKREGPITVTAYVSKRGKVLAAGVAATKASSQDAFDCIADELRQWHMPKPRKGVAKVSFPLQAGA